MHFIMGTIEAQNEFINRICFSSLATVLRVLMRMTSNLNVVSENLNFVSFFGCDNFFLVCAPNCEVRVMIDLFDLFSLHEGCEYK